MRLLTVMYKWTVMPIVGITNSVQGDTEATAAKSGTNHIAFTPEPLLAR